MTKAQRYLFALMILVLLAVGGAGFFAQRISTSPLSVNNTDFKEFAKNFHSVEIPNPEQRLPDGEIEVSGNKFSPLNKVEKGQIRLINVWATWCAPCVVELPLLKKFQAQHPDIKVILLSYDLQKSHEKLEGFLKRHKAEGLTLISDSNLHVRRQMPFPVLPTTLIVDENDKILYKIEGEGDWTSPSTTRFFNSFMSSSQHGHTK